MNETLSSRERILAVARSLFAQRGFRGTSVRAIIGEAGVNLGAVTYHFGGKSGLYEAVLDSLLDPLEARVRAAAETPGPPLDRIAGTIHAITAHVARNPDQAHIVLHELALRRPLPERARRWIAFLFGTLTGLIAEGQADGTIIEGSPGLLAASVVAQPFYFAIAGPHLADAAGFRASTSEGPPDAAGHLDRVVRRLLALPRRDS
jgi:AcrR family transcriptional regulator